MVLVVLSDTVLARILCMNYVDIKSGRRLLGERRHALKQIIIYTCIWPKPHTHFEQIDGFHPTPGR